ncbi:MAG: DUF5671 domain-containing protein [Patescibacteria group bacterium]
MDYDLLAFTKEALAQGIPRGKIQDALLSAGWEPDEVRDVLERFQDADFPIPVPRRKPYLSAKEAFMYLLMFLTLYISSVSFGTIIFQNVNRWLPDVLLPYGAYDGTIEILRMSTSSLLVAYPVFLFVAFKLKTSMKKDVSKRTSKIRKWLTYITLFIAAGVIIGDLITLVFNFLGGELTLRFVIKVVTVGVIAGTVFGYYLWDLKNEEKEL